MKTVELIYHPDDPFGPSRPSDQPEKINMAKPTIIRPGAEAGLTPAQRECVALLTSMLEDAKRGDIWSMVVVACGPNDFGSAFAGADAPRMILGLEVAKANIMERVTGKRSVLHR